MSARGWEFASLGLSGLQELKFVPSSLCGLCGVVGGSPRAGEEWPFQPSWELGRMPSSLWPALES